MDQEVDRSIVVRLWGIEEATAAAEVTRAVLSCAQAVGGPVSTRKIEIGGRDICQAAGDAGDDTRHFPTHRRRTVRGVRYSMHVLSIFFPFFSRNVVRVKRTR